MAKTLLIKIMEDMQGSDSARRELGSVAAKYVENLQRSNEQMVKISALIQKGTGGVAGLTEEDKADLYDVINKDSSDGS